MGVEEHRQQVAKEAKRSVNCAVITVTDTRTEANDASGKLLRERLEEAGHAVVFYRIVKDEPLEIRRRLADCNECTTSLGPGTPLGPTGKPGAADLCGTTRADAPGYIMPPFRV